MTQIAKGTRVRFTAGHLGLVCDVNAARFESEYVGVGDEGAYGGPHPQLADWHVIEVEVSTEPDKRTNSFAVGARPTGWSSRLLFCPCHRSHFEVIA